MTLPASGQIDILQILAEFGAPVGTPLTSMVRGGAYVPNTAQNAGVPTAPPISCTDFYGASAVTEHSVSPSPSSMGGSLSNGVGYGEGCTAVVSGGIGPFTYSWFFLSSNFGFSITNSTSQSCIVNHSGATNATRDFQMQCNVTDTGNGSLMKSFTVDGSVTWGTPP